ncbi:MAG TPA: twin-arginine translocase TatA/TatE family subunit [Acidimicrobiia bacterium]|nr:twin-arginine translocase TatA/TatE family subunit [Acidimicrobiia bacterium]
MFEGLLAPWHLVIIALVLFMVVGPQKLADRWKDTTRSVSRLVDGDDAAPAPAAVAPAESRKPRKLSLALRLGRRLRRLRRRRP